MEVVAEAWPSLLEALHWYSPQEPGASTGDTSTVRLSSPEMFIVEIIIVIIMIIMNCDM